jgi:hypothetical protein
MSTLKLETIATQDGTESTEVTNVVNGSAKAWVNFNGTGTVAIRRGFNVSSITDHAVGQYTVNFTTAMPDVNYSVSGQGSLFGTDARFVAEHTTARTTTTYRFFSSNYLFNPVDGTYLSVAIFS